MTLRRFNNLLSVVVIVLGLYISISPFIPEISRWFTDKSPEASAPYEGALASLVGSSSSAERPNDSRLVIPSIQVNEPIIEGPDIGAINNGGTWRRPQSGTPTESNNTVIVGHRYFGNNISTFYHLDKVLVGHKMAIYWEGQEIIYEVVDTKIVDASAIEIEAPTVEKQLTIYTCHPIWTAKDRLVIIAKPFSIGEES